MKRENFYRRNPDDALSGMVGMSLEERGVYNTVIDLIYLTWRPLEDSRAYIANHCGCAVQRLNPILNRLIERRKLLRFEEDGIWYISNRRFEDERKEVKGAGKTRSGRREVGEKSAGVREKSASVEENPPLLFDHIPENQPVTPLEKKRVEEKEDANASFAEIRPNSRAGRADPVVVERLWACQPICGGKRKATRPEVAKALLAALKRGGDPADIEVAFRAYYALPDCTRDGGQFARGAAVLLNDDKWRDFLPSGGGALGSDWPDSRWQAAMRIWREDGSWEPRLGPTPGQPGCKVPSHLLIEPAKPQPVRGAA